MAGNTESKPEDARGLSGPTREKYWKELTLEEKVERLRLVVKEQQSYLDRTSSRTSQALRTAQNHQHAENGTVLVSVHQNGMEADSPHRRVSVNRQDPDAVYF